MNPSQPHLNVQNYDPTTVIAKKHCLGSTLRFYIDIYIYIYIYIYVYTPPACTSLGSLEHQTWSGPWTSRAAPSVQGAKILGIHFSFSASMIFEPTMPRSSLIDCPSSRPILPRRAALECVYLFGGLVRSVIPIWTQTTLVFRHGPSYRSNHPKHYKFSARDPLAPCIAHSSTPLCWSRCSGVHPPPFLWLRT